jgi:superfamily I DNA/RNA helicase
VIPGTIHSVKGGEAQTVILIPDLSLAAVKPYWAGETASIGRLFYVAMTRASERLLLCRPAGPYHADLPGGLQLYREPRSSDSPLTQSVSAL